MKAAQCLVLSIIMLFTAALPTFAQEMTVDIEVGTPIEAPTETAETGQTEESFGAVGVAINAANFPDSIFRDYVKASFDKNGDNTLSAAEIAAADKISIYGKNLTSVKGIEYFTELGYLLLEKGSLTSLDVSKNTKPRALICNKNQLTSLDISSLTQLYTLICNDNKLTSLDLSRNASLAYLDIGLNQFASIDTSHNPEIYHYECGYNDLTTLDLSHNAKLKYLYCNDNPLTQLDLSKNPALEILSCSDTSLTSLDLNSNPKPTSAYCQRSSLTKISFARCMGLYKIVLSPQYVTALGDAVIRDGMALSYNVTQQVGAEFLNVMYKTFFDRAPDAGGKADWAKALSSGMSREFVICGFANSNEFFELCMKYDLFSGEVTSTQPRDQNINLTAFVSRLYSLLLGRQGDEKGLNDWCRGLLTHGVTPKTVAQGFVFSDEFKSKNYTNRQLIEYMYRAFLGREYDERGMNDWLRAFAQGRTREDIFNGFANSDEFKGIVASFGL